MLWPWNAAALPEIMAEDVQDGKRGVPGGGQAGEQQASKLRVALEALPPSKGRATATGSSLAGARGHGAQKPSQGLTFMNPGRRPG